MPRKAIVSRWHESCSKPDWFRVWSGVSGSVPARVGEAARRSERGECLSGGIPFGRPIRSVRWTTSRLIGAALSVLLVAGCGHTERNAGDPYVDDGMEASAGAGGATTNAEPEPGTMTEPTPEPDPPMIGSCACDAEEGEARVPLECFCEGFPEMCPSYEASKALLRYGERADVDWCDRDRGWIITERIGCGRRVLTLNGGFSGASFVYDDETLELLAVSSGSDTPFGPCGAYTYEAGEASPCDEGTLCSLCDEDPATCVPACSIMAWGHRLGGGLDYETLVEVRFGCGDVADSGNRAMLRRGCGFATVHLPDGAVLSYADATHDPVSVQLDDATGECGGVWGQPPPPCDEETVCTLCEGAEDACAL